MDIEAKNSSGSKGETRESVVRRIRMLWAGLIVYFLIMLNAVRYAREVPYQILILGGVINLAIIMTMVIAISRAYKRLRN
ncbi:MAG: hypothetical protein WCE52_09815 [Candidatus Acidiferrum sp.]